ncbi:MAG: hypothetical protein V3V72_13650 [Ignavibacteriaceae bacterium]
MNKIESQLKERKQFVKLSIDDPQKASVQLMEMAGRLSIAKRAKEKVEIISEILRLSHRTIYRDFSN